LRKLRVPASLASGLAPRLRSAMTDGIAAVAGCRPMAAVALDAYPTVRMQYFQEWRTADRAALAAERQVFAASMHFIGGQGPGPTRDEIDSAHKLRATADDLFASAMREMEEVSQRLRQLPSH
jgi:hypothetical protein